jgi:hypothetical protein
MLIDIKSLYGKICVALVSAMWALYLAQSIVGIFLAFVPGAWRGAIGALLTLLLVVAVGRFLWPRVAHLGAEGLVNSTKVAP